MVSPIHRKETTVAYTQKAYSALLSNGNDSTYKHAHFTSVPNTKKKILAINVKSQIKPACPNLDFFSRINILFIYLQSGKVLTPSPITI